MLDFHQLTYNKVDFAQQVVQYVKYPDWKMKRKLYEKKINKKPSKSIFNPQTKLLVGFFDVNSFISCRWILQSHILLSNRLYKGKISTSFYKFNLKCTKIRKSIFNSQYWIDK